jgi:hypothetical protein
VLENRLHPPETAASQNGSLLSLAGSERNVDRRLREWVIGLSGRTSADGADGAPSEESGDARDS